MKRYHNRTLSPTSMGRFEIFEDGSWTKSDPLFSCLSKESRCAMHHGKPVFFLLILLLPFGPLPIPPADHVASPILLTNYNLSFNIHYVQNIFYLSKNLIFERKIFATQKSTKKSNIITLTMRKIETDHDRTIHRRFVAICNPILSTEQMYWSRTSTRPCFLQGARLKTTCRCSALSDDNLLRTGESNTRVHIIHERPLYPVSWWNVKNACIYLCLKKREQERPWNEKLSPLCRLLLLITTL